MENPAFDSDTLVLPPPTEVSPTQKVNIENTLVPPQPIVLNPGVAEPTKSSSKRGALATFGLLLAGWFVGNLIIVSLLALAAVGTVGSTGLVRVPLLTNFLFGKVQPGFTPVEIETYQDANLKIDKIENLGSSEKVRSVEFSEAEINALLNDKINNSLGFPIANQKIKLSDNRFIFTGNLVSTNAPVEIIGRIQSEGLNASLTINQAKFGKLSLPIVLANAILDQNLGKIGLSLSGINIPAESIKIIDGQILLKNVINPNSK